MVRYPQTVIKCYQNLVEKETLPEAQEATKGILADEGWTGADVAEK